MRSQREEDGPEGSGSRPSGAGWGGALRIAVLLVVALTLVASAQSRPSFTVVEASITDMRRALEEKRVTSRELVQQSLTRIAVYEDILNAIITVNTEALQEADALDRERAAGRVRGPLHGIPIALKD